MKTISLTKGKQALVDDEDYERLSELSWHATSHGYAATRLRDEAQTHVYMHRMVLGAPPDMEIDHANGNGLDNRRCNLRLCVRRQNAANTRKRMTDASSRYKGVCFNAGKGLWLMQFSSGPKQHKRHFRSENEAAAFYNDLAQREFGEFAVLNKIELPDRVVEKKPTRFEDVSRRLADHWGFRMWKNDKSNRGYREGEAKCGYTVAVDLRGLRYVRFDTLAEIERAFLSDGPPPEIPTRRANAKPVLQLSRDGSLVKEWISTADATEGTGVNGSSISLACNGKLKSAGGFLWRFK